MRESQHIEWKESWHDDYIKWICGFANASGGMLIIGKNDKGDKIFWMRISRLLPLNYKVNIHFNDIGHTRF
jgi:ATP-dependent DNA helicase RecG